MRALDVVQMALDDAGARRLHELLSRLVGSGGHVELTIDGERQLVLWRRIDRMGWTYVVTDDVRRLMRLDVSPP